MSSKNISKSPNLSKTEFNAVGILFSIFVTVVFVWAVIQWYMLWSGPKHTAGQSADRNERYAFLNLQIIAAAQNDYIKTDWDSDGKKTYAKYFVHLWTSVDTDGNPVTVELIPQKLAFASGPAREIDGYYFIDLHDRLLPGSDKLQALDYEKEWAVMAVPLENGQTDMLYFLADNSGCIFVKSARYVAQQYLDKPLANGWKKITSIQQLP